MEAARAKLRIYVDADACPVKDEVYRVAARYVERRHEAGARHPPERGRRERVAPPPAPACDRAPVDGHDPAQALKPRVADAVLQNGDQHDDGRDIHPAPEEAQRRRRRPRTAAVDGAAKAEALVVLRPETTRPPAGFAGVARHVPAPATGAALGPASLRQITVDGEQEVMESGVGQQRCVQGCVLRRKRSTPMAKPGRNDRCPCGSGKKYKACCLTRDEAAELERLAAEQAEREARAAATRLELRKARDAIAADFAASHDDDLDETVDAALRFIQEGKLEETETAARHLIDRYPDIPDGWEFLGHVHENRGENREAVACYRRVLEIIDRTPDDFDPEYTQRFVDQIAKLDPPQAS